MTHYCRSCGHNKPLVDQVNCRACFDSLMEQIGSEHRKRTASDVIGLDWPTLDYEWPEIWSESDANPEG